MTLGLLGAAAVAFSAPASFGAVTTVTTLPAGTLPEDIVSVPAGFGTRGGTFFVNDATVNFTAAGHVYDVPAGGGSFSTFANTGNLQPIGGVFLPSNYGALASQYLAAGNTLGAPGTSDVVAFSSTATQTPIGSGIGTSQFADTVLAPAGFDSAGGQIVLANEGGTIYTLSTGLTFSALPGGTLPSGVSPFGLVFVPAGFGTIGGDLLISDAVSGKIYALSPTGTLSLFATVPLGLGQFGDRQMAFAPADFGPYAGDLFVSVSGSNAGGGIAGSVDVLNSAGNVIAFLAEGTVGMPYDPRGLLFPDSTHVWIADADPSVLSATSSDFTPGSPAIPEPASLLLLGSGLACLALVRRHRQE